MAKRKKSTFERLQSERWSRKERRQLERLLNSAEPGLSVVHADAAGIDVGNESHFVAVPPDRAPQPVREFGSWTEALRKMAEWLQSCGIRTVAMQSTGVYWVALLEVLEAAGLEVYLVNARGTKNLPGRKSDVQECQWLLKLHTYGLLRNSFRPPEQIRAVRTAWQLRERWVQEAARAVQQMQKALTKMNVQLANTISDLRGVTGMAILRAIVSGVRDRWELAKLRDPRIQASEAEIAASLEGNWREDVLFELRQVLEGYDFYQKQIRGCDAELQKRMAAVPGKLGAAPAGQLVRKAKPRGNQPRFDLAGELRRTLGVDLTTVDGIDVMTA
jgi:transposase